MKKIIAHRMLRPATKISALVGMVTALAVYSVPVNAQTTVENDNYEWARQMGEAGNTYSYGNTVDDEGNVYVAGAFQTSARFGTTTLTGNGNSDIFITKLDSAGNFKWAKGTGSSDADNGYAVAVDNKGHVYLVGSFSGTVNFGGQSLTSAGKTDGFVCQLNSDNGDVQWVKPISGTDVIEAKGINIDGQGNIYITGYFAGTAHLGSLSLSSAGGADAYIAKMDATGNFLWAKSAGGGGDDVGTSITTDKQGNVFVSGNFSGTTNIGGNSFSSVGGTDVFITKLNASGTFLWAKAAGGKSTDETLGIGTDDLGNVYMSGTTDGGVNNPVTFGQLTITPYSYDFYTCKLDGNGNFVWVRNSSGVNLMRGGEALAVAPDGTNYTTGWFTGIMTIGNVTLTSNPGSSWDVFVVKRDKDGEVIWAVGFGGPGWDYGEGLTIDKRDNLYVSGVFSQKVDFDPGNGVRSMESAGGYDGFILKLSMLCGNFKNDISGSANEPLCLGDTLKLEATSGAGYVYQWEGPDGFTSNLQNPIVPNVGYANAGYYVLSVTNAAECQDGRIVPVAVNPHPIVKASANTPVCEGDTLNLIASGGGTFEWVGPNGYSASEHLPSITNMKLTDSGTYIVTVTSDECSATDSVTVVVDPLPVADFTVSVTGNTVTVTNETAYGDSFHWDFGDGNTSTDTAHTQEHKYDFDNTHYTITLIAKNDCGSDTIRKEVDMTTGIVNQEASTTASIFPNPFTDDIRMRINLTEAAEANLMVYDVTGSRVYVLPQQRLTQGNNEIDLKPAFTNLPSGIYMVHVTLDSGASIMRKVVKVK